MKRLFFAVAALCLSLFLCSCRVEYPDSTLSSSQPPEEDDYQYGNRQVGIPAGDFILYGDRVLFTWNTDGRNLIYEYDIAAGEVNLLCKDATCAHTDCVSGQAHSNLEQYRGVLYGRSTADQIVALKNDSFAPVVSGAIVDFWHAGGNLYVETADRTLIVYEKGSKTPRVLLEEYTQLWNTVFGGYLYSGFGEGICRVDLQAEEPELEVLVDGCFGITDGQHFYYPDTKDDRLYRCNMDGSDPELLVDHSVFPGALNFDETFLYYRLYNAESDLYGEGSNLLYRMSKDDPAQTEKIAEFPEGISEVYTIPGCDLLFVCTNDLGDPEIDDGVEYYPDAVSHLYVLNTDGSHMTRLEFPEL